MNPAPASVQNNVDEIKKNEECQPVFKVSVELMSRALFWIVQNSLVSIQWLIATSQVKNLSAAEGQ